MIQYAKDAENAALLAAAQNMCAAARTAPKTKGEDYIVTAIVTGEEKETLAVKMEELAEKFQYAFFLRDAGNVRNSQAVVLLGFRPHVSGLNGGCRYCGFQDCADCVKNGGTCAFGPIDLGIAAGSAVGIAGAAHIDCRIMFSAGRAALELGYLEGAVDVLGIPLSVAGKSPYFDRK
ncbi:MAG: ferredoxin [Oscillospiraceae bacterium]|nr:ferredoxin [Oscillospiraceae bacterium]